MGQHRPYATDEEALAAFLPDLESILIALLEVELGIPRSRPWPAA